MTRVDFYSGSIDKLRTACQLSHKAMQHGLRVLIRLPDAHTLDTLDRLLWHYPDTAFIPHCRSDAADAASTPVILSLSDEVQTHQNLLINLHDEYAPFFNNFDRVSEIVGKNENDSRLARERYKFYRENGGDLRHIDLTEVTQHP
jgi:DNA polymerase-3 subunit chi